MKLDDTIPYIIPEEDVEDDYKDFEEDLTKEESSDKK
jgi:hypothetical protein|tara:strand:- start:114 stop:224 length:111 start_codon:yes stop_codon:yes gene_type:complete